MTYVLIFLGSRYCTDLRAASQEIQSFLESAEAENVQLHGELAELRELLEEHPVEVGS